MQHIYQNSSLEQILFRNTSVTVHCIFTVCIILLFCHQVTSLYFTVISILMLSSWHQSTLFPISSLTLTHSMWLYVQSNYLHRHGAEQSN